MSSSKIKLRISKDVELPIEVTTRRSAVFGISGSGKSNSAVRIIERLLDQKEQVVLVDPKGEGYGLQTSADGKHPGYDVIVFGQPRGDIPELREEHAEQIADFVVDTGRSVVLSLLGFDSDQSERRFVTRFFQRLYRRKSQMTVKTRTLVVLEEAHLFIPEQASGGNAEMVGAIKRISRQGRSAGLGLMIVDQRPQDVAKSIISQCELLICHQLTHKLDRAALMDWIKAYDSEGQAEVFLGSLATLQPGEPWVWSPGWLHLFVRTKIERRKTYDTGATPDGSPAAAPKARAKINIDDLRTSMAKIVEEQKANDPTALKRRVAELEKAIGSAKAGPGPASNELQQQIKQDKALITALKKGLADAMKVIAEITSKGFEEMGIDPAQIEKAVKAATGQIVKLVEQQLSRRQTEIEKFRGEARKALNSLQKLLDADVKVSLDVKHNPPFEIKPAANRPHRPQDNGVAADEGGRAGLTPTDRDVLDAAASFPGGATKKRISVFSGRSIKSSSFTSAFSGGEAKTDSPSLVQRGLLELVGDKYVPTEAGMALAQPTQGASLDDWMQKLTPSEAKVLECIAQASGERLTKDEVSKRTGQSTASSSFTSAFPALRDLGLIEGTKDFAATEELMSVLG